MTDKITVPRATWDAMRGALTPELVQQWGELKTMFMGNGDSHEVVVITLTRLRHLFDAALTAANAVSHPKPETAPPPEGGAITSESAAAFYEQAFGVKLTDSAQIGGVLRLCNLAANAVSMEPEIVATEGLPRLGNEPEILAEYTGINGVRQWASVGAWLYPGDAIAVISDHVPDAGKMVQPQAQEEAIAWVLEWTFNGEEKGRRLYDDETHCKFDAEQDGGVCRPLVYGDADHPQATEPAGWKLVPVEPTQQMLDAVVTTLDDHLLGQDAEKQYREDWAAMLAAAPEAKQ